MSNSFFATRPVTLKTWGYQFSWLLQTSSPLVRRKRLMFQCAAHLVGTPNRDMKLLLGRARFWRLKGARRCAGDSRSCVPKGPIDKCPSDRLELALDEALHCENNDEVAAVTHLLHAGLIFAYGRYLELTNPLADAPSCDLIKSQLPLCRR
jgi:hypothetical protein